MQALMYFFKLTQPLTYFYSSVTVHCKGERRKTKPPSRWFKKSIQKPQQNCTFMNSALCPETSTKLYVHEFGFNLEIMYTLYLILEGVDILISESLREAGIAVPVRAVDLFTHKKHMSVLKFSCYAL
jgi:hypothetical protein